MKNYLKVSIITVCYNSEKHISDCLRSVKEQTYPHIEHVLVDGGSSDGTMGQIRAYAEEIERRGQDQDLVQSLDQEPGQGQRAGRTVSFGSGPDKGIYDAINKGISRATGDIIGILHSDDLFAARDTVETIAQAFSGDVQGIYGDMVFVQPEDVGQVSRVWKAGRQGSFARGWSLPHQTLFLRRGVYEKFGGYVDTMTNAADYEFVLRICRGDGVLKENKLEKLAEREPVRLAYIPKPLVVMKLGGASTKDAGSSAKGYGEVLTGMKMHGMKLAWLSNALRLTGKLKQRILK